MADAVGPIRLVAGVEALNGLLLIGWSVSYAFIGMVQFWSDGGRYGPVTGRSCTVILSYVKRNILKMSILICRCIMQND